MHAKHLFSEMVQRREILLIAFEKINQNLFHSSLQDNTWTPESLFRHLLTGMTWMTGTIGSSSIKPHPLALMTAQNINESVKLSDIKKALNETATVLIDEINQLTDEKWNEKISTPLKKDITRETSFISLIFHELEHLGQIKWILKRLTGWTDKEIYALRVENTNTKLN